MILWKTWWDFVVQLRPAFSRTRTFLWFAAGLAGACIRPDLAGVTSYVRALGLRTACYESLLEMFHSSGVDLEALTRLWTGSVIRALGSAVFNVGGRPVRKRPKVDRSKKSGDFQLGGQGLDLFGGQPFDRG